MTFGHKVPKLNSRQVYCSRLYVTVCSGGFKFLHGTKRKLELKPFIEKRRILNSVVHGCAVHQWTSAYYLVQEKLNEINADLIGKYNEIAALVNYFNWMIYFEPMFDMGQMPMVQGVNKVTVSEQ